MAMEDDHTWLSVIPEAKPGTAFLELQHSVVYESEIPALQGTREDGWVSDNVIAVAFELLGIWTSCSDKGISLMNPTDARALCQIGVKELQNFGPEDLKGLEKLKDHLQDKRWVFIPINDGYQPTNGNISISQGSHWCLLVVDLVCKKSHYIDSFGALLSETAGYVDAGMQRFLGFRDKPWGMQYEQNSPSQIPGQQNDAAKLDKGACGPFFYAMAATLVWHIIAVERDGRHWDVDIPGHPDQIRFDSFGVRKHLHLFMRLAKYVQTGDGWSPELADHLKALSGFRTLFYSPQ
ncbi:uncharacterized protein BDZ99DRAFT_19683 [Mytilinidion resinicola]|uniref:Ubiquitin-like protease family profile domain-containing protein n=1 Tax=Mytilinidion resinicola TaxID=574789 RepID=A0A6A6ZA34_9PEZI|nr:uncharacterized protein BDZ99DRAFT_19683 [Mytilinidion resinicola]KAF2817593.1 hypothetical protein BDZ99DRAFT_19683 [Mytilinidion resinicola]